MAGKAIQWAKLARLSRITVPIIHHLGALYKYYILSTLYTLSTIWANYTNNVHYPHYLHYPLSKAHYAKKNVHFPHYLHHPPFGIILRYYPHYLDHPATGHIIHLVHITFLSKLWTLRVFPPAPPQICIHPCYAHNIPLNHLSWVFFRTYSRMMSVRYSFTGYRRSEDSL